VNWILAIALELRLAGLFVLGACLGSLANLGICRLAWHPRPISPWSRPDPEAPPRRPGDRIPILGWLGLRREAALHGSGFWIRPMLMELALGIGFAALYWWETCRLGLLPPGVPRAVPPDWMAVLHQQYAVHLLLIWLMIVASLIDIDEKTIPDAITVWGALLGLLAAAAYPWSLLPAFEIPPGAQIHPAFWHRISPEAWPFLRLSSPNPWPPWLDGFPQPWSLVVGLGCWWLWCVALMPRTWYSRHGWVRAFGLMLARLRRESATRRTLVMGLAGSVCIAAVWLWGKSGWVGLISGLVGMAAGGGLVWLVRIIGKATLRREAMGFGDVTLMAMVGAFFGWQACLAVFFIAPFAGLAVGLVTLILHRNKEIPYGPFLCLGAVVVTVFWARIWDRILPVFWLGWAVPLIVLAGLVLMGLMLALWQKARQLFRQARCGRR